MDITGNMLREDGPPRKKRKKSLTNDVQLPKNPIMVLNEIKPNLAYDITCTGPAHARIYSASVTISGQTYTAEGPTKKKAKARVAEIVLQCSVQLKDPSLKPILSACDPAEDFSQDPMELDCDAQDFYCFESAVVERIKAVPLAKVNHAELASNNPVYCLNKLKPGIKIDIVKEEGDPHAKKYTARVTIEDQDFEGVGTSKKQARNQAAQNALQKVFDLELPTPPTISQPETATADYTFGNYISQLVEDAYKSIMKDQDPVLARYKVLAGVVMTCGPTADGAEVVTVTTGSKCISGGHLNLEGEAVNDCHAEVLARRGLVDFLYDQLEEYATAADSTQSHKIFEPVDNEDHVPKRLKVKTNVLFHLFVSSAPCGDARIFTLNDSVTSPLEDLHPNRQGRGALRTKIESGEGTVPVNETPVQTWDGILQGERLLTMSCSDKLARWNVVGVQGSLLSHLINPIYFHTIVVGNLYHQIHLRRALIGRIEHLQGLPSPFLFSRPVLTSVSSAPDRLPAKSPKHSICWALGWSEYETIEIAKGKLTNGSRSRLSKRCFFQRFVSLVSKRSEWCPLVKPHVRNGQVTYASLKRAAREFGEAKEMMQSSLVVARLGQWVKKPLEQDIFEIPIEETAAGSTTTAVQMTSNSLNPMGF